jgi:hypothetical protein
MSPRALELDGFLARPRQWKMDMRFGTWKVRSLYRAGSSQKTLVSKLAKYKFDLLSVQEVRWYKGGI